MGTFLFGRDSIGNAVPICHIVDPFPGPEYPKRIVVEPGPAAADMAAHIDRRVALCEVSSWCHLF